MNNELMLKATGQAPVSRQERPLVASARQVVDQVRMDGLKAQGIAALTDHTMATVMDLHKDMKTKAGGDQETLSLLAPYFLTAAHALHLNQQAGIERMVGGDKYGF